MTPPSAAPITNATVCRSFAIAKPPLRRRGGEFSSRVCTSSCQASHARIRSSRKRTATRSRPGGNLRGVDLVGKERSESLITLGGRLVQPGGDQRVSDVVGKDVGAPERIGDEAKSLPRFRLGRKRVVLQVSDHVLRVPVLFMEQKRRVARSRAQDSQRGADG